MASSVSDSFYQPSQDESADEVDSLPSSDDSSDFESEEEARERRGNAQKEWEESLQQLELVLTMVIVPYAGKYFGRKFAYWGMCFHSYLLSRNPCWSVGRIR
jgi:hypothetical protein